MNNKTSLEYKKALSLFKTAEEDTDLDIINLDDIDDELTDTTEISDLEDNDNYIGVIDLDNLPAKNDKSSFDESKKQRDIKPTGIDATIMKAMEGKGVSNGMSAAEQKQLDNFRLTQRIQSTELPNPEITVDQAKDAVSEIIKPNDLGLEDGLSTEPKTNIFNIGTNNLESTKYGPYRNRANRALEYAKQQQQQIAGELINEVDKKNDNKIICSFGLYPSVINAVNKQRESLNLSSDYSNELTPPTVTQDDKGFYVQDNESTLEINKYLEIYGILNLKADANKTKKFITDPLFFNAILASMDEKEGHEPNTQGSRSFEYAGYIYQMVEISTDLSRKISKFEKSKLNRLKMGMIFISWLHRNLKDVLEFISEDVNKYLELNPREKLLELNSEVITKLIDRSGGYLNTLINASLMKKDIFINVIAKSLNKEIEKHVDTIEERKAYKTVINQADRLRAVCSALLQNTNTFKADSPQAETIVNMYLDSTMSNSTLNVDPFDKTTYKYPMPFIVDETTDKVNKEGNNIIIKHPPDKPQLDSDEAPFMKEDTQRRLFTEGVEYKNEEPILEYKVYPDTANKRITILTHIPDSRGKQEIEQAFINLQKIENILNPTTIQEKKILIIGKKIVAIDKIEALKNEGKVITKREYNNMINRPFDSKASSTSLFDEEGNRRTDLSNEEEDAIMYPRQVIAAARKYFNDNPDIFDLCGTFKINDDKSITKINLDAGLLRNYGVKQPELLPSYRQIEDEFKMTHSERLKHIKTSVEEKQIADNNKTAKAFSISTLTKNSSINDAYKYMLNKFKQ